MTTPVKDVLVNFQKLQASNDELEEMIHYFCDQFDLEHDCDVEIIEKHIRREYKKNVHLTVKLQRIRDAVKSINE
jgi:hypothetical protein